MQESKNSVTFWRTVAIIALCLLVILGFMYASGSGTKETEPAAGAAVEETAASDGKENPDASEGNQGESKAEDTEPGKGEAAAAGETAAATAAEQTGQEVISPEKKLFLSGQQTQRQRKN